MKLSVRQRSDEHADEEEVLTDYLYVTRGHFEGERVHGNAVPIVKKLSERMGTVFPLLERMTDAITNHFRPKMLYIAVFCIYSVKSFPGVIPPPPDLAEAPPVLGPRHQFPLGSPAFQYCCDFTKRPLM